MGWTFPRQVRPILITGKMTEVKRIMSDEITTEETTEAVEFEKAAGDQVQGAADRQGVKPGVSPVENATGNPGTTANVGNPNTHHASGYIGVGGVGQQNDGDALNYGNMGQALNPQAMGAPSPIDIDPSGQVGGGVLNPEQSRQFIDYVWDATMLARDGRRITMRANTMELEKVNVGQRVLRAAAQADGSYENAGATFSKVDLATKKLRLDWEISTEALEDNIEGAALEDHLVRLMTQAFANDIEDLAINGDLSQNTDPFLGIMDGFCVQVDEGGHAAVPPAFAKAAAVAGEATTVDQYAQPVGDWDRFVNDGGVPKETTAAGDPIWDTETMQEIILAMPRKYRAIKSGLRFYAGSDTFAKIVASNGTGTPNGWVPSTEQYANAYLDGNAQEFGGPRATRVLGVPVLEVPYFPEDRVELTFPANRIWGIQRDITVNREYQNKKDTIEYTVFMRFGIAWEELDAVAVATV